MNLKTQKLLLNTIGCIAFLSIPIISSPDFNTDRNLFTISPFLQNFLRQVLLLVLFYANYYYFLPKLYFSNKKWTFIIISILCFGFIFIIPNIVFPFDFISKDLEEIRPKHINKFPEFHFFDSGVFQFITVQLLSYLIKISLRFDELKTEKLNAEVSYLKAQINPHFLFNTLNSLYALTIIKSDEAPSAVLKLSGIMRYVVTESEKEFVSLDKEINYIEDYIELQKLRMDEATLFSFKINGTPIGKKLAPLLLIPFIENAFKYGLNPEEDSEIVITIDIKETFIKLDVKNKIVVKDISEDLKTEKGIENTSKRLEIMYPNKHQLKIVENKGFYHIQLSIDLI